MTFPLPILGAAAAVLALLGSALPPPVGLRLFAGGEPREAWPVLVLIVAAGVAYCSWVAGRSLPLGLLALWGGAVTLWRDAPAVPVVLLAACWASLALYRVASDWPPWVDRWLLGALTAAGLGAALIGLGDVLDWNGPIRAWDALWAAILSPWGFRGAPGDPWRLHGAPFPVEGSQTNVVWRAGSWVRLEARGLPHGLTTHPNHFGLLMALAAPAAWAVLPRRFGIRWAGVLALVTLLGLSRTRTAWVGLALAGLVLSEPLWPRAWRRRILAGIGIAALLAVLGLSLWTTQAGSLGGRWAVWRVGLEAVWERPWSGWGLGVWRPWATHPRGSVATAIGSPEWAGYWADAFSEPLQLAFELGLPGAALGLWALAAAACDAWARRRPEAGPRRAWAGVLLVGATGLWTTAIFHHLALGLPVLIAAARLRGWAAREAA